MKKYILIDNDQIKIGKVIKIPYNINKSDLEFSKPNNYSNRFSNKPIKNVYEESQKKDNTLLYIILKDRETKKQFIVFNYHMPCAYWWPAVMTLHIDKVMELVNKISQENNNLPYIILGDFNTIFNNPLYNFITKRKQLTKEYLPYFNWKPLSNITLNDSCDPKNMYDMEKIYPTTQCENQKGKIFKEKLDYIFYSKEFKIIEYKQKIIEHNMPNDIDGSDHIPISANF
jgi:endonuclease/exonuclease/phosphatase family metal-dependent hydrolase